MIPPIVVSLISQGLGIIGNAVLAKGQDEIEKKLGVKLDSTDSEALRKLEVEHEEFLITAAQKKAEAEIAAEQVAQTAVTARWQADMLSDSSLSKNIRPTVLLFLLVVYAVFSLMSVWGWNITQAYVELLAQMLMLVMGAYFAGRTVEKIVDMRERGKTE